MTDIVQSEPERSFTVTPRHVAIIMDGNGRWAVAQNLPRIEGHRNGAKSVRVAIQSSIKYSIRYLTLYGFSSENWSRPHDEVADLMGLLQRYLLWRLSVLVWASSICFLCLFLMEDKSYLF